MVNSYVGETYKLVFPLLSKGYLNLSFNDNNVDTTPNPDVTTLSTIWEHTDAFTLEAIITPYDVNGDANRTTGNGVLTSTKTPPYPNDGLSNRATTYQSTDLLGRAEGTSYTDAPHKLMIFYNTNLKVYLENTTLGSYNQPAEYKVVAQLTKGGVTKTIESGTVIKANEILFNQYDPNGYYANTSSKYTKLTSSASNVSPSAVVTVSGSGLPVNTNDSGTAATGSYTVNNHGSTAAVSSEVKATATIDIGGSGTDYTVPADTNVVNATGTITIKSIQSHSTSNDGTELIIYHDGTGDADTYRFFARTIGTENAGAALVGSFGTRAFAYHIGGSINQTAQHLELAIRNAMPTDIVTSYDASNATITLTMPARSQFNNAITLGTNLNSTDFVVSGMANGNAGSETNSYLTITDHADVTKHYKASDSEAQATGTTGTSSGTAVVYYRNSSSLAATANNLRSAILGSNGHGSSKFSITYGNPLTLTSQGTGSAGNSSGGDSAIADTNLVDADLTYTQFTGGANEVKNNNFYVMIDNTVSGNVTKNYQMAVASDATFTTGSTGTSADGTAVVYFAKGADNTATAGNLETAIESSNGHNGGIVVSGSGTSRTLTQATIGSLNNEGNTTITNYGSGFSNSNFSSGSFTPATTPNKYLEVTDAAGTVRRYHAATIESQNSTATIGGVVYVYFTNHATPATLATNLETAIEHSNGHNGSISVSRSGAVLTLSITTDNNQAISETFDSNLAISSAGSATNNVYSWNTSNNLIINVSSNEAIKIGRGSKIYDSSTTLVGTVASVGGNAITLTSAPATTVTSTLYVNQPKEALYLEEIFKISLTYNNGMVSLFVNSSEVVKENTNMINFQLHASDCKIGRGSSNSEQFYGELYEIAYHKGKNPCEGDRTLTPSYNDILLYYRFGV